jgi:hypothetical protein
MYKEFKTMPAFALRLQKNFQLNVVAGLPQAEVETINGAKWLQCCPLCGCTHQIIGTVAKKAYTPTCQTLPLVYKAQQISWHKLHPAVTPFATLQLTVSKSK